MNKDLKLRSGMSEIERLALKNREEHLALLRSLKIDQAKEDIIRVVEELKPKKKPKLVKRVYKNIPSSRPWMRKNRMLQKLGIDFLLRKSRRLEELNTDLSLRKSRRIEKLNINLSECVQDAKAIAKAEKKAEENIKKKDFIWTSKEISTYECDLSSNADNRYVSRFPFMKIDEVAKVVPSRITAMALNPLPDRIIVTAADVSGNMSFWKVDSESDPYLFKNVHHQKIPHLQYNPVNPNMIFSCSYDGSIRCGDLENRVFSEVYVDKYSSCSYFDFLSPVSLIVGKKSGCIDVVDFRNGKSSAKSHECHGHLIETVSIHPVNKHYFITAMRRTVSVWDLRKLQRKPVASITHPKNTTISAYFSPVTGNSILTTFCDHSLCLFDSSYLTVKLWLKTTVRHGNFTGQATWLPETDDVFMIGSEAQPGRIQILNDNMKNIYNFMDEDLSATAVNRFHPSKSVLAGSNPNGKVFVFVDSQ